MKDIYTEITNEIISQLEQGIIPWQKPWTGAANGAISYSTGRAYSLINQMLLLEPGEYITFNQCKAAGGHVKKGSKARVVVFWKVYPKQATDENGAPVFNEDGTPKMKNLPVLKYFQVFNLKDCEGIEPRWNNQPRQIADPIAEAEEVFSDYISREGIAFEQTLSDRACYSPISDRIHLPLMSQFSESAEYYSTAFHEATHSTGHFSRLNRFSSDAGAAAFGSEEYSKEELVAEIGAATILSSLGISTDTSFRNSVGYIQGWLKALKNDKRLIVSAAARAEKAVKLILNQTAAEAEAV